MRRLLFVILVLGASSCALAIGPVGDYLGYRLNLQAVISTSVWDSVHLTLPTRTDTVSRSTSWDTTIVDTEVTYRGLPGYALHTASWTAGTLRTSYDTTYESTDVYLKHRQTAGDSAVYVTLYNIPFSIGDWWRTGAEGMYFTLPDSTGQVDTIRIWADTSRVVAQETVTTLYGIVPDCYRIRTFSRWFIATSLQGIPIRDSQTVVNVQWYKDSLWLVKDSTWSTGKFYAFIFVWLPAGVNFISVNRELVSLGDVGVKDVPVGRALDASGWKVTPNPFRGSCRVTIPAGCAGREIRILDVAGRVVFSGRARGLEFMTHAGLRPGVYRVISPGVPGAATIVRTD